MEYNRRVTDDVHGSTNMIGLLVKSVFGTAAFAIAAIVLVSIYVPDSTTPIVQIVGVATMVAIPLIALIQRESNKGVNGRVEQLIAVTGEQKRLGAVVETLAATTAPEVAHLTTDAKQQARDDKTANGKKET